MLHKYTKKVEKVMPASLYYTSIGTDLDDLEWPWTAQ